MECRFCLENIDAYFDKELPRKKRRQIDRHLERCANCKAKYLEYKRLMGDLQMLEPVACPDEVTDFVWEFTGAKEEKSNLKKFLPWSGWVFKPVFRPLSLAAAAIILVLVGILTFAQFHKPEPATSEHYSKAEIRQASEQVKLALAYVNAATTRASEILEKQILPEDVIEPMRSSLKQALQPLWDGGKS